MIGNWPKNVYRKGVKSKFVYFAKILYSYTVLITCISLFNRRAKLLLRKKKFQETLLSNTDKQLENLEKLAADIEFAQVEIQVLDGLKQGNVALKKMHAILDINEIEKIMDETREGIEKQQEIDSLLTDALTQEDEDNVMAELDALVAEQDAESPEIKLPEVPKDELPEINDTQEENATTEKMKAPKEKVSKVLLEA